MHDGFFLSPQFNKFDYKHRCNAKLTMCIFKKIDYDTAIW